MREKLEKTGTPCVYKTASKPTRYAIRVKVTEETTGKQRDRMKMLPEGSTMEDAKAAVVAHRSRTRRGTADAPLRLPTLTDFARQYVERKATRNRWAASGSTEESQLGVLNHHILPTFGEYFIDKVTTEMVERWVDAQIRRIHERGKKKGSRYFKDRTINLHLRILKAILNQASKLYHIPNVATPVVDIRVKEKSKDLVLTQAEARLLLDASLAREKRRPNSTGQKDWFFAMALGFGSGARPSELLAAKVQDFDLSRQAGRWLICRHVVGGNLYPGTKDDPDGDREVYLNASTTQVLRGFLVRRQTEDPAGRDALLFPPNGRGKRDARSDSTFNSFIELCCRDAEIKVVSGKTFRQTHATWSRQAGVPDVLTQAQLGHSSLRLTDIYTRPQDAARAEAAQKLADVVSLTARSDSGT